MKYQVGQKFEAIYNFNNIICGTIKTNSVLTIIRDTSWVPYYVCTIEYDAYPVVEVKILEHELNDYCKPILTTAMATFNTSGLLSRRKGYSTNTGIEEAIIAANAFLQTERTIPISRLDAWLPKCECGSTAVGSPFHSTWCPMHLTEGKK